MRLDKLISDLGLATRKECALYAKRGQITVDGVAVRSTSVHVDPEVQRITLLGKPVEYNPLVCVMLNKPEGYVSATEDTAYPPVTDLLPEEMRRREVFPVGRLDKDTVGLMLLTNDGWLAHSLLSPKRHVAKKYRFKCKEPLSEGAEELFCRGITLGDGYECKSALLVCDEDRLGGEITLTEGKYHQIKRMLGALSNKVTYLERVSFAHLTLDPKLNRGEWRTLTDTEIAELLSLVPKRNK